MPNKFLGFDVSSGMNLSYLYKGLSYCAVSSQTLNSIICLLEKHFKPKLNQNGLFVKYDDAKFFLECVRDINFLQPNTFDDPSAYEVIGLSTL